MALFDPRTRLKTILDLKERNIILGLMDIIEGSFGFDYVVANGTVVEVRMVATALVSIPRGLGDLPNLYRLQLQSNRIKRLRNLQRCQNVQNLTLNNNEITSLEVEVIKSLKKLQTLDISFNKIDSLQPFNQIMNLESLNIADNQITTIPPLNSLSHLKYIDISGNPISHLENIHTLESLIKLKMDRTQINSEENEMLSRGIAHVKDYCRRVPNKAH